MISLRVQKEFLHESFWLGFVKSAYAATKYKNMWLQGGSVCRTFVVQVVVSPAHI